MAVMNSASSNHDEVNQRSAPLPTTEKMADLDINGAITQVGQSTDTIMSNADASTIATSQPPPLPSPSDAPLPNGAVSSFVQQNGSEPAVQLSTDPIQSPSVDASTDNSTTAGTATFTEGQTLIPRSHDLHGNAQISLEETTAMDVDKLQPSTVTEVPAATIMEESPAKPADSELTSTTVAAERKPSPAEASVESLSTPAGPVSEPPSNLNENTKLKEEDMKDAPPSPNKNVRAREEDDETDDGPSTKRTRTGEDATSSVDFKKPEIPSLDTSTHGTGSTTGARSAGATTETSRPLTKAQYKFILSAIRNLKRTKDAQFFNVPVDPVKLQIPTYPTVITSPMDLGTVENRLKLESYTTVDSVNSEFELILSNTMKFNGPDHLVTTSAVSLKAAFDRQMSNLPKADVVEPSSAEKKAKKAASYKTAPARRESRHAAGAPPSPATTAGSPTTFALQPSGTPLIRRDSTVGDGRPKREIHPPPPRDLPYTTSKPKKKKFIWELKFCQEVLNELLKPKYVAIIGAFRFPVDPVALMIPHYHKIIKKPMDISTVMGKLKNGEYENAKEFDSDMKLIFSNCYKFNPPGDPIHHMGKQLEVVYDDKWAQKKEWIEDHVPVSAPNSVATSPEPEDDDDEEDEEEEQEMSQIDLLQQQIEFMKEQVESMRKKKDPSGKGKKASKNDKTSKKPDKKASTSKSGARASAAKPEKKKKPVKKERTPYITYEQKQEISNRINTLPSNRMQTALKIIRDNMPNLKGIQDDELELDIDELSDEVLHKLFMFVQKYAPGESTIKPEKASRPKATQEARAPSKPKKNKPMNKTEQEAQINELQNRIKNYQKAASHGSPESHKHTDNVDSSDDDDDDDDSNSESEEE